jgi:hypothetical protein
MERACANGLGLPRWTIAGFSENQQCVNQGENPDNDHRRSVTFMGALRFTAQGSMPIGSVDFKIRR